MTGRPCHGREDGGVEGGGALESPSLPPPLHSSPSLPWASPPWASKQRKRKSGREGRSERMRMREGRAGHQTQSCAGAGPPPAARRQPHSRRPSKHNCLLLPDQRTAPTLAAGFFFFNASPWREARQGGGTEKVGTCQGRRAAGGVPCRRLRLPGPSGRTGPLPGRSALLQSAAREATKRLEGRGKAPGARQRCHNTAHGGPAASAVRVYAEVGAPLLAGHRSSPAGAAHVPPPSRLPGPGCRAAGRAAGSAGQQAARARAPASAATSPRRRHADAEQLDRPLTRRKEALTRTSSPLASMRLTAAFTCGWEGRQAHRAGGRWVPGDAAAGAATAVDC